VLISSLIDLRENLVLKNYKVGLPLKCMQSVVFCISKGYGATGQALCGHDN